jgi:amino acid transporter
LYRKSIERRLDLFNCLPLAYNQLTMASIETKAIFSRSDRLLVHPASKNEFRTFGGVFTPCLLTILGAIMFLRFGYIAGNAGLQHTLIILLVCKLITILTAISLSSIVSNTKVGGGGVYYFISRSLGVEFGGAIGIVFYLALSMAIALHVIGFAEALSQFVGNTLSLTQLALLTNVAVFLCVFVGAGWTIKIQYFILATLGISLVSFSWGAWQDFRVEQCVANWGPQYLEGQTPLTMFALFFPACIGITTGANMSGDLRSPRRSIPTGTIGAIVVSSAIYLMMLILLTGARTAAELSKDNLAVFDVASSRSLITVGVFAATLSSALGLMMGAPRIIAALAQDNIFSSLRILGRSSGKKGEPRAAIVLTFGLSSLVILAGDLNSVAPFITMSFMLTYGLMNLATFYEIATRNPSYRPTFRFGHWLASLLGASACGIIMFLLDWQSALISVAALAAIYALIYQNEVEARWGDLTSGILFERTRKNLLKLEKLLYHPKNWRPIILAFSGSGWKRPDLAILGDWLTSGHGILSLGHVLAGDLKSRIDRINDNEAILQKFVAEQQLDAFPNVVAAPSVIEGIEYLIQCSGIGALRPNTLLIGWPSEDKAEALGGTLRAIAGLQRNVILSRFQDPIHSRREPPEGFIDVWWRGHKNGELMLLLAHLLRENTFWRNRTIRLLRIVADESAQADVLQSLKELATLARIKVEPHVIVSRDPVSVIRQLSSDAAVVFLGFDVPDPGDEMNFFYKMESLAQGLPRVLFVDSVGNMKLES